MDYFSRNLASFRFIVWSLFFILKFWLRILLLLLDIECLKRIFFNFFVPFYKLKLMYKRIYLIYFTILSFRLQHFVIYQPFYYPTLTCRLLSLKFVSTSVNTYFVSTFERSKLQKTLPFQLGVESWRASLEIEIVSFPLLLENSILHTKAVKDVSSKAPTELRNYERTRRKTAVGYFPDRRFTKAKKTGCTRSCLVVDLFTAWQIDLSITRFLVM